MAIPTPADSSHSFGRAMVRRRLLIFSCLGLALLSCLLAARVWSPALSAANACQHTLEHIEGYGPWHVQSGHPLARAQTHDAVVTYFDGVNTASCHAQRYGPIWIVVGVGQTMVSCGRGLSADWAQECPRGMYGVIP